MYAVVVTGGKQYRVSQGSRIVVDQIAADVDAELCLGEVLMVGGEQVQVGTPTVSGAQVHAKVVAHQRGEKTEYTRYLHRRRMRRQKNGRAYLTVLDITRIEA